MKAVQAARRELAVAYEDSGIDLLDNGNSGSVHMWVISHTIDEMYLQFEPIFQGLGVI